MPKIQPDSLMTLEAYARSRKEFRAKVMAHKRDRTIALGDHVTLIFEDELTIRYQVQEMLRIERIFEEDGIRSELDAYNPLIPDGRNFKATMLIEYTDVDERKRAPRGGICTEQQVLAVVERQPGANHPARPPAGHRTCLEHGHRVAAPGEIDRCRAAGPAGADHRDPHATPQARNAARQAIANLRSGVSAMRRSSTR
jgi:hypothetical protein